MAPFDLWRYLLGLDTKALDQPTNYQLPELG